MQTVTIGLGTCGISAGGEKVLKAFQDELKERPNAFELKETGCVGMCYREVLVEISNGNGSVSWESPSLAEVWATGERRA
mgnify:CR=1 FL=1